MRVFVVCVGKLRSPFMDDAAHYERLLRHLVRLEVIEVREARGEQARAHALLAKEWEEISRKLPERSFVVALDRRGKGLDSRSLARFLEERRQAGLDLAFVVGGPFGLAEPATKRADLLLSFGPITLPHQLARVVPFEQLFRAHKILAGEPYHY